MSTFCNSCQCWSGVILTRCDHKLGICDHPVASKMMIHDTAAKISDEDVTYTAQFFGCVHYQAKGNFLIDITKITNNETNTLLTQ